MRVWAIAAIVALLAACGSREFGLMDSLALCDHAIKSASINPKVVEIPHRSGTEAGGRHVFEWQKGGDGVLMPNQFGAMLEVDAVCEVDPRSERVVRLVLNGNELAPK